MADQSIRITNLPDPGSPERVAFDLMDKIRAVEGGYRSKGEILQLFKECLHVARHGHLLGE